jgi:hypothetical protein
MMVYHYKIWCRRWNEILHNCIGNSKRVTLKCSGLTFGAPCLSIGNLLHTTHVTVNPVKLLPPDIPGKVDKRKDKCRLVTELN